MPYPTILEAGRAAIAEQEKRAGLACIDRALEARMLKLRTTCDAITEVQFIEACQHDDEIRELITRRAIFEMVCAVNIRRHAIPTIEPDESIFRRLPAEADAG